MSGPNAPRIIVIPQSMLAQAPSSGKSILRISPQGKILPAMSSVPQGRILPTMCTVTASMARPLLTNTTSILSKPPVPTMMVKPVASVAGQKRPAPLSSLLVEPNTIKKEKDENQDGGSVRKRANLDHLSPEERLMRRKLKNRVAAQTARDKKRLHLEDMEIVVRELREEKKRIVEDNARLQATNSQLQLDNAALIRENRDLSARLSLTVKTEQDSGDLLPLSPESMPRSPLPINLLPLSPVSQPRSPAPLCSPCPSTQRPSESAEGSGSMCGGQEAEWPRVVVQRLDDLASSDLDGVVAHACVGGGETVHPGSLHGSLAQQLGEITDASTFGEAAAPGSASITSYQEEMQVGPGHEGVTAGVNLPLLDLGLETLMDTPTLNQTSTLLDSPTTESMLDKLLESAMVGDMEDGRQWNADLEDLFPDLV